MNIYYIIYKRFSSSIVVFRIDSGLFASCKTPRETCSLSSKKPNEPTHFFR